MFVNGNFGKFGGGCLVVSLILNVVGVEEGGFGLVVEVW